VQQFVGVAAGRNFDFQYYFFQNTHNPDAFYLVFVSQILATFKEALTHRTISVELNNY
jgi:hypothetical protein